VDKVYIENLAKDFSCTLINGDKIRRISRYKSWRTLLEEKEEIKRLSNGKQKPRF